ncbi:MAG: hypothetical protein RMK74_13285 [Myxococcales bacterium]|nr:hypothetical protein [Myxococcales bacterium]
MLGAVAGAGIAALGLGLGRAHRLDAAAQTLSLGVAAALPLLFAALSALRPVSRLACAARLDRAFALRSRVAVAVDLAASGAADRSAFARAAVEDARDRLRAHPPHRAARWRWPRSAPWLLPLGAGLLLLAAMYVPLPPSPRSAAAARPEAPAIDATELEALEDAIRRLERRAAAAGMTPPPELQALRQLLEELRAGRIDRTRALARIAELLEAVEAQSRAHVVRATERALRAAAGSMREHDAMREAARALETPDARRAAEALRHAAEALRQRPPSRRELDGMRRALREAADRLQDAAQEAENERRLLQREASRAEADPEPDLLRERMRELERLRRDVEQREELRRRLERLRRELERSAEGLDSPDAASRALDAAAEAFESLHREGLTDAQREALRRLLEQLRESMRRGGADGGAEGQQGRHGRMRRFELRAGGSGEQGVPIALPGQAGTQGSTGRSSGQGGSSATGQQGEAGGGAERGPGSGSAQPTEEGQPVLVPDARGDSLLVIPGLERPGRGNGSEPQRAGSGSEPGTEHDPTMLDDPTRLGARHQASHVAGLPVGQGPTRRQVIFGAAQGGFATRSYERVYEEYAGHAEEVLERDQVPPGYRFYVRRYFELVRPRVQEAGTP